MTDALSLAHNINEKACLQTLSKMVQQKSHSETEGERVLAENMIRIMRQMGLESYAQPVEGDRINAIGIWRGTGGGESLLLMVILTPILLARGGRLILGEASLMTNLSTVLVYQT